MLAFALTAACAVAADEKAPKPPKPAKIEISVVPGALRYATTRFDATAGSKVELTLKNTCVMPHNLVLVKPGTADAVVVAAMALAGEGLARNFVPPSADVLASTPITSPGQAETIKLTIPSDAGEYPYLCTFPGHGTVMRGIMRVRPAGEKLEAPIVEKLSTIKLPDALKLSGVSSKPMGTREHPFVMRSFVPNPKLDEQVLAHHGHGLPAKGYDPTTGKDIEEKTEPTTNGIPAGVAVSFGPEFAYVWDTTECRLLYAWTGGFLNMQRYWGEGTGGGRAGKDYVPEIDGTLVYKAAGALPLQLGKAGEKPKFKGYKLLSGIPDFTYEVGGVTIHESIVPSDPGTFMVHCRIERPPDPVRMVFDPNLHAQIRCDQGGWKGDTLEIPADHADHFMLLVKFAPGETYKSAAPSNKKKPTSEEP